MLDLALPLAWVLCLLMNAVPTPTLTKELPALLPLEATLEATLLPLLLKLLETTDLVLLLWLFPLLSWLHLL